MRGNMMVRDYYAKDNTEGYSAEQLAEANRRLSDVYSEITDDDDGQILKQLAGDVLTAFDTELSVPAPRWTLAPGRWLCYDGKPMVALMLHQEKETGARNCQPHHADDLAHLLVYLLTGEAAKNHYYRPVEFPLSKGLADEARAVTPVTLPTA